ncbi:MAG: AAA family ATPase [Phycisphaerales bacterium]
MRTIAIINQKGGCGKTTTAINLAGVFSRSGLRTLLVDLDPQSHCAAGLAIPEQRIDVHIGDAMLTKDEDSIDWMRLLWRISRNLDLAPSTVRLAGLESARGGLAALDRSHQRLTSVVSRLADQYDICLIDCPPAIGLLTYNALVAASEVLVPVETAFFALQGAGKQISTIKALAKRLGVAAPHRLLATMHHEANPLACDLLGELNRRFEGHVSPVVIRYDTHLREAVSFGQPVVEYAPHSAGAQDYTALGRWLIENPVGRTTIPEGAPISESAPADPSPVVVLQRVPAPAPHGPTPALEPAPVIPPLAATSLLTSAEEPVLSRAADLAARAQRLLARTSVLQEPSPRAMSLNEFSKQRATARAGRETGQSLMGVRHTSQGVLFVQPLSAGKVLAIAGDFNRWSPEATPMRLNPALGVYEAVVPLPPGRFQYRIVADGLWITDVYNPDLEPNPFGEANSVIDVTSEHAATQTPATSAA